MSDVTVEFLFAYFVFSYACVKEESISFIPYRNIECPYFPLLVLYRDVLIQKIIHPDSRTKASTFWKVSYATGHTSSHFVRVVSFKNYEMVYIPRKDVVNALQELLYNPRKMSSLKPATKTYLLFTTRMYFSTPWPTVYTRVISDAH
jgi:hypothetical protein